MDITADQIIGKPVYDFQREKLGKVGNLYIDEASHQPTWVTVKTGLLGNHENFVPLSLASIDDEAEAMFVAADRDTIENAPQIETGREITPGEQDRLYQYYRRIIMRERQASQSGQSDDDNRQTDSQAQSDDTAADTDRAMTRSEEELTVDKKLTEAGRARLKKYVVTETANLKIPLRKERLRVTREPITDENRDAAMSGQEISEAEHEITLHQEEPVVGKRTVPKERYRVDKEQVTDESHVSDQVRKEKLNLEEEGNVY